MAPGRLLQMGLLTPALFSAWGCGTARSVSLGVHAEDDSGRARMEPVLAELNARRKAMPAVVTRLHLVYRDLDSKRVSGFEGQFFGESAGNMRMRILQDETVILDLAYLGEQVKLYLPRRRSASLGLRTEVADSNNNVLALLAHIGNAPELFFPSCPTAWSVERRTRAQDGREVIRMLDQAGVLEGVARRFFVRPGRPWVEQVEVYNKKQTLMGTVRYEDYVSPGPTASAREERKHKAPYPRLVTLVTPDGKRELEMQVLELLQPEAPIPAGNFELKIPKDIQVRDLGAALRSAKDLWD